jgi:FkbM family methyltransferase
MSNAPEISSGSKKWEERARQAVERKNRMLSFGPNVRGLLVATRHGMFTVDPEDGVVSAALLHEGIYNEPEYMLAKSLISKTSDVLVVGAHIGAHAVPLSKDCKNLIAIEANPHTFNYLTTNFLLNKCSNVAVYNIAAGDKAEKIKFLMSRDNSGGSKKMPLTVLQAYVYDNPYVIEIDAMPLDTLIGPRVFDLILMDIEGSEYFALKGMQQIVAGSKALSVEFLPHHLRNVASVDVDEFLGTILPHFEWMYIPRHNRVVPKQEITELTKNMYWADEEHDGLLFLKNPLPDWLKRQ